MSKSNNKKETKEIKKAKVKKLIELYEQRINQIHWSYEYDMAIDRTYEELKKIRKELKL